LLVGLLAGLLVVARLDLSPGLLAGLLLVARLGLLAGLLAGLLLVARGLLAGLLAGLLVGLLLVARGLLAGLLAGLLVGLPAVARVPGLPIGRLAPGLPMGRLAPGLPMGRLAPGLPMGRLALGLPPWPLIGRLAPGLPMGRLAPWPLIGRLAPGLPIGRLVPGLPIGRLAGLLSSRLGSRSPGMAIALVAPLDRRCAGSGQPDGGAVGSPTSSTRTGIPSRLLGTTWSGPSAPVGALWLTRTNSTSSPSIVSADTPTTLGRLMSCCSYRARISSRLAIWSLPSVAEELVPGRTRGSSRRLLCLSSFT
jgi:hypothetical protein